MSRNPRPYYSMLVRQPNSKWTIQFGDYERPVVAQEMKDERESWMAGTQFLIVKTDDGQDAIQRKVDELNSEIMNSIRRSSMFDANAVAPVLQKHFHGVVRTALRETEFYDTVQTEVVYVSDMPWVAGQMFHMVVRLGEGTLSASQMVTVCNALEYFCFKGDSPFTHSDYEWFIGDGDDEQAVFFDKSSSDPRIWLRGWKDKKDHS